MKKTVFVIFSVLCGLAFFGCSKNEVVKTVSTDGSTSMEKVIGILGEVFTENNKDITFTYNPTGSGTGIASVYENRCDIVELIYFKNNRLCSKIFKEEKDALKFIRRRNIVKSYW